MASFSSGHLECDFRLNRVELKSEFSISHYSNKIKRCSSSLCMIHVSFTEKVQDEIEQVLGSNPPRTEHRTQMPYTDAVIHEIQRFANILPLNLPHETTEDVTLKGYFIPKVRCQQHSFPSLRPQCIHPSSLASRDAHLLQGSHTLLLCQEFPR